MLRVLVMAVACSWGLAQSESASVSPSDIAEQQRQAREVFKELDQGLQRGELQQEVKQAQKVLNKAWEKGQGPWLDLPKTGNQGLTSLFNGLDGGVPGQADRGEPPQMPIILISLSMPKSGVKALIDEAAKVGAVVVLRGLVEGDFNKTLSQLKEYGGDDGKGLVIDPSLFRRFNITQVPSFVLPLEPIPFCTIEGCEVPKHVRGAGASSLQYFLDLVARSGTGDERDEAAKWLAKY